MAIEGLLKGVSLSFISSLCFLVQQGCVRAGWRTGMMGSIEGGMVQDLAVCQIMHLVWVGGHTGIPGLGLLSSWPAP